MELKEISLAVIDIDKDQPRKDFNLTEIRESIRQNGVLVPIMVQPSSHGGWSDYIILDGERRFRAAKELGLKTIPAVINYSRRKDRLKDQVTIDHQRHQLTAEEKSQGWLKLLEQFSGDFEDVAKSVGVSVSQVKNVIEGMQFKERVREQLPDDLGRRERAVIRRTNRIKDDNLRAKLIIKAVEDDESNKLIDEKVEILSEKSLDNIKISASEQKIILNAKDIEEAIISIKNMRREASALAIAKKETNTETNIDQASKSNPSIKKLYHCPHCQGNMKKSKELDEKLIELTNGSNGYFFLCQSCESIFIIKL